MLTGPRKTANNQIVTFGVTIPQILFEEA